MDAGSGRQVARRVGAAEGRGRRRARPSGIDDPRDGFSLNDLTYSRNVVQESLRLHPAGLVGVRQAARDIELGGFTVRRGTLVVWSPYLAGRDAATWTDPLRFDPDRFVGLTPEQQALADQAWVPFGRGPHMCLGFGLAQMELTLIISRMAQRLVAVIIRRAATRRDGRQPTRRGSGPPGDDIRRRVPMTSRRHCVLR